MKNKYYFAYAVISPSLSLFNVIVFISTNFWTTVLSSIVYTPMNVSLALFICITKTDFDSFSIETVMTNVFF